MTCHPVLDFFPPLPSQFVAPPVESRDGLLHPHGALMRRAFEVFPDQRAIQILLVGLDHRIKDQRSLGAVTPGWLPGIAPVPDLLLRSCDEATRARLFPSSLFDGLPYAVERLTVGAVDTTNPTENCQISKQLEGRSRAFTGSGWAVYRIIFSDSVKDSVRVESTSVYWIALFQKLEGDWREEHLFVLRQSLESYRHLLTQMETCDAEFERTLTNVVVNLSSVPEPERPANPPVAEKSQKKKKFRVLKSTTGLKRDLGNIAVFPQRELDPWRMGTFIP